MIRLNILCEDAKVSDARARSASAIGKDILTIPLSTTGKYPATHWFCSLNVTPEGYRKILALKYHSTIEEGSPKQFLMRWNLKIIKNSADS